MTARARKPIVRRWPVILGSLLLLQAGGVIGMVVVSGRDPSFAIEPDYYEKALAWDQTSRQREHSASLGWSIDLAPPGASGTLVLTLRDRLGRPLEGAAVTLETYHHARASDRATTKLPPAGDGRYAAPVPLQRAGLWEARITIVRGPDTFTATRQFRIGEPQ